MSIDEFMEKLAATERRWGIWRGPNAIWPSSRIRLDTNIGGTLCRQCPITALAGMPNAWNYMDAAAVLGLSAEDAGRIAHAADYGLPGDVLRQRLEKACGL